MLATTVNPTMTPTGNLRMSMPPIKWPIVAQGCAPRPVRSWRVSWASRQSYLFGLLGYCSAPQHSGLGPLLVTDRGRTRAGAIIGAVISGMYLFWVLADV